MADESFREDARCSFLFAIEETAPQVLEDLEAGVRPAYQAEPGARNSWRWRPSVTSTALDTWAKRWNLDAEWCRETAMRTLGEWDMPWEGERPLVWSPRTSGWMQGESVPAPAPWTPGGGRSPADVRRELRDWYEIRLAELALEEEAAKGAGMIVARARFTADAYRQAVRYQVLGESFHGISGGTIDPKPLRESIHAILRLIGLPERAPSRGGKPKAKPRGSALKGARRT